MKKLTIKGVEYEVRNEPNEVTLNELAKIAGILEKEGDYVGKWLSVIEMLGSRELVEVLPQKQFVDLVKSINISDVTQEVVKSIEINGRVYECDLDNLTAKDMSMLEKAVAKGGSWGVRAFAIVFKDVDLTSTEHYTDAHIKHKADVFGQNVTANIAAPVIFALSKLVVEHVQSLIDAQNPSVQGN